MTTTHNFVESVCFTLLFLSMTFLFSDLLESMRQAELCDWALDPALFTSLCDSLNRFFAQKGMITSGNNSPLALGAPHSLQVPPFPTNPPPTLASLTHPSPLPYSPMVPPISGAQPPRRALHMQGQGLQRPQLTQPANATGKTWTSCWRPFQAISFLYFFFFFPSVCFVVCVYKVKNSAAKSSSLP